MAADVIAAGLATWLVVVVGSGIAVVVTDRRRTRRPAVVVGPPRRLLRWIRSLWLRSASAVLGWPHLVDVALGTPATPVAPTPATVAATFGRATLQRYDGPGTGEPILVVHSLVTRPWVLDLTPTRSMVAHLLAGGFDVWLLDWGVATAADATRDLDAHVATLREARTAIERERSTPAHVLGYCLGATVALMDAATAATPPPSLALVAPVADVAVSEHSGRVAGIGRFIVMPWSAAGLVLDHRGLVPGAVVREAFHLLRPRALRTVWTRVRMPREPELRRAYGVMARWAWEQPPLPGATFLDLVDIHRTNALTRGLDLARLRVPTLVAYSERDHIVASPTGLLASSGAEHVGFPGGHVGMLVGSQAPALYETLRDFFGRQAS
jgi:polyhydroxyalkanoate synthase